jgi:phosphoribosylglycinamide formyltransferase-1
MAPRRVGILISGSGTNLEALIGATREAGFPAEIGLVLSNREDAFGLVRARRSGIAAAVVDHRAYPTRALFEAEIDARLRDAGVDLVCLAGFMRVLTAPFVLAWHDRILNIHPSLLPAFAGLDTHARVLAAGVRASGCTVHLVRPAVDSGPIIVQGVVPVLEDDTPATLGARVLELEHVCYPLALGLVASGEAAARGERIVTRSGNGASRLVLHPSLMDAPAAGVARGSATG